MNKAFFLVTVNSKTFTGIVSVLPVFKIKYIYQFFLTLATLDEQQTSYEYPPAGFSG